jgi:hypothetical protein
VAQLAAVLRYKREGRELGCREGHWDFILIQSFGPHFGPGIHSASNNNKYQGYFLEVRMASA